MNTPSINIAEAARVFFRKPGVLPRLILINTSIFLLVYLTSLVWWLFALNNEETGGMSPLVLWMAVPSDVLNLSSKPWTILTYMFLHEGFLHLLFNMLILYFGGVVFLQYLSPNRCTKLTC